jgi:hypothetical protein
MVFKGIELKIVTMKMGMAIMARTNVYSNMLNWKLSTCFP